MASSAPILDFEALDAAKAATANARRASSATAAAAKAAAATAEDLAALAWASHEACEKACAVAKRLPSPPAPDPSPAGSYPKASCGARGAVAMKSMKSWRVPEDTVKETAAVAVGGAGGTWKGTRTNVLALRAALVVAEAAEQAAKEAAEAVHAAHAAWPP